MRTLLPLIGAALCLSLQGCAWILEYQQQQEAMRQARIQAYTEASDACLRPYTQPETAVLRAKIPPDTMKPSIKQLGDKTRPNAKEKAALEAMDAMLAICHSRQGALYREDHSVTYTAYLNQAQRTRALLSTLWSGQITFGQYNAGVQQINADVEAQKKDLLQQQAIRNAWERAASDAAATEAAVRRMEMRNQQMCLENTRKRDRWACYY